jgi:DNA polymerase III epsilon subunit-like protein
MELPRRIVHLTGIDPDALRAAPPVEAVRAPLLAFLGDAPVFAHNADFDRGFLVSALGELGNAFHDTCFFACLVLPDLVRYGLDHLVETFGLAPRDLHTALNDARLTREMFDRLILEAARSMPFRCRRLAAATPPANRRPALRRRGQAAARMPLARPAPARAGGNFNVELSAPARRAPPPDARQRARRAPAHLPLRPRRSSRRFPLVSDDVTRPLARAPAVAPRRRGADRLSTTCLRPPGGARRHHRRGDARRAGIYLSLLERRPLLCRADIPYVLHRSAAGGLVDARATSA